MRLVLLNFVSQKFEVEICSTLVFSAIMTSSSVLLRTWLHTTLYIYDNHVLYVIECKHLIHWGCICKRLNLVNLADFFTYESFQDYSSWMSSTSLEPTCCASSYSSNKCHTVDFSTLFCVNNKPNCRCWHTLVLVERKDVAVPQLNWFLDNIQFTSQTWYSCVLN